MMVINPTLRSKDILESIKLAFERNALLDSQKITVEAAGNKVVLHGKARNHSEREEAERAAWSAPGVESVDNQIRVEWSWHVGE